MPSASNAKIQYEGGQTFTAMSQLTNSGDDKTFTSAATYWSKKTGFAPIVRPNGILTGGVITPDAANDQVDVSAASCNLNGVITSVTAGNALACARPSGTAGADYIIHSITVNSSGAYAVVSGTESTALSETRGAAGGPPYIPVDSIEVGQIRYTSPTSALVVTADIFAVDNLHRESAIYPGHTKDYDDAQVVMDVALPQAHTGDVTKRVYASFADPIFVDITSAVDFKPPQETATGSSTAIYGKSIASVSTSLGQGSFKIFFEDGISDSMAQLSGQTLWFKFFPDRTLAQHWLTQGRVDFDIDYPADADISASATITAETAATRKLS